MLPGMVVLTNADGITAVWTVASGERGAATNAHSLRECLRQLQRCGVMPIDGDPSRLFRLSAVLTAQPFLLRPNMGSHVVLREPAGLRPRPTLHAQRLLPARAGHFIHRVADLIPRRHRLGSAESC